MECNETCVTPNGKLIFKNPSIEHREHQTLKLKGYFYPVQNTAVYSVSIDGVD